ncbi:MAG: ribosome maturation factor RimP [Acidimicrobiia bacterium]
MAGTPARAEHLETLVAPVLAELSLAMYDLSISGEGRTRTVRVSVERADGGPIDLEAIADASRAIDPVLDADDSLRGAYTLEVSSPGLERALRRPAHFARALGQVVTCKTTGARWRGVLTACDDTGFVLEVDGETQRITYSDATNVRTVFEWGVSTRPTRQTRSKEKHAS